MPLGQGIAGALGGLAAGGPIGGLLGGIGGLFGLGQSHEDPQMRAMRQQQQGFANQMAQYAGSVPGSSPDELANMSQARGLLGQQQRANQQRAFANYNPSQGLPASQMLANLGNANIAQQMAQQSSFLQDAAANRRQALMQAANLGQGAAALYKPQQSQFGQVAGQLAQMLAYQKARAQGGAGGAGTNTSNPAGLSGELAKLGVHGPGLAASDPYWSGTAATPGSTSSPPQIGSPEFWQQVGPQLGTPTGTTSLPGSDAYWSGQGASVQGQQGAAAPGNEQGGINGLNNQIRQSSGASTPMTGSTGSINAMLRKILLPGGVSLHF